MVQSVKRQEHPFLKKKNMFPFDVYGLTQRSVPAAAVEVTGVCVCVLKTLIS